MKRSKSRRGVRRVRVSADGAGVVSHAGVGMLREVADLTGLIGNVTEVLADTYQGPWVHEPGRVFADLAVALAVFTPDRCAASMRSSNSRHVVVNDATGPCRSC